MKATLGIRKGKRGRGGMLQKAFERLQQQQIIHIKIETVLDG